MCNIGVILMDIENKQKFVIRSSFRDKITEKLNFFEVKIMENHNWKHCLVFFF